MENADVKKLQCPYPSCSRNIKENEYDLHLRLCRQRNISQVFECIFDKTHAVPKCEFEYHMKTCGSRNVFNNLNTFLEQKGEIRHERPTTPTDVGKNAKEIVTLEKL